MVMDRAFIRLMRRLVHPDGSYGSKEEVWRGWATVTPGGYRPERPVELPLSGYDETFEFNWERLPTSGPNAFK